MKNLINILLYVLLALLVVAISVMVYKKFKSNSDSASTADNQSDMAYVDSTGMEALPFTAEDSLVLGLTGELPTQVGPETDNSIPESPPTASVPQENISPVAKPVSIRETVSHPNTTNDVVKNEAKTNKATESKAATKTETKTTGKTETKASTNVVKAETKKEVKAETKASSTQTASTNNGKYYVISGSFLVPNNADNQVAKLKKMGFFNAKKVVFTNSSSYSAVAGQYESEAAARASLNKLKSKGEAGFIKKM